SYENTWKVTTDGLNSDLPEKLVEVMQGLEDNNKKLRYATRLQTGKLDGRRLTAYKTSDKLFKKKAIKHKDYQFTILVDTSGSMFQGPTYIDEDGEECNQYYKDEENWA